MTRSRAEQRRDRTRVPPRLPESLPARVPARKPFPAFIQATYTRAARPAEEHPGRTPRTARP